jgi:exopolysaccharide production protein ExoQ
VTSQRTTHVKQQGRTPARLREPVAPSIFEKCFVVLVLLLSTSAFLNLTSFSNADSGMPMMQVLWSILYAISFGLIFKHSMQLSSILRRNAWLVLIVAFAVSSAFWSDDPSLTLRRGIALVCTTIFGLYFAECYQLRQQLRLLAVAYAIAAGSSIIFQAFGLGTAVDFDVPGWIGVYDQKNVLGVNMAFAAAVLLLIRKTDPKYRNWATLGLVTVIGLLLLSQSMTAIVMLVAAVAVLSFVRRLRTSYRSIALSLAIIVPISSYAAAWIFQNLEYVTGLLGKDPTMTGRLQLWVLSVAMALQRPWLGYGYSAFWRGYSGPSARIWRLLSWQPPHSHNGFLEVWLGIGLVGLAIFLLGFGIYFIRAIRYLRNHEGVESCWPLMFLVLMFVSNLTGANILARNAIFWIVFVATGVFTVVEQEEWVPSSTESGRCLGIALNS